VAFFVSGQKV
jgi:hypothetical protein